MTFVDTNYLVRFLINDIETQHLEAKQLFLSAARGEVSLETSLVVFFETAWVLRSAYDQTKEEITESLYKILTLNIEIVDRDLLFECLYLYRVSSFDLIDCYNLLYAKQNNSESFKTFDKKLIREFEKLVGKKS